MASMVVTSMTESVGFLVNHQRTMAMSAVMRHIQSNFVKSFLPFVNPITEIMRQKSPVTPVFHAPAPPFSTTCAANAIDVRIPHTSHEKACGIIFLVKISLK